MLCKAYNEIQNNTKDLKHEGKAAINPSHSFNNNGKSGLEIIL